MSSSDKNLVNNLTVGDDFGPVRALCCHQTRDQCWECIKGPNHNCLEEILRVRLKTCLDTFDRPYLGCFGQTILYLRLFTDRHNTHKQHRYLLATNIIRLSLASSPRISHPFTNPHARMASAISLDSLVAPVAKLGERIRDAVNLGEIPRLEALYPVAVRVTTVLIHTWTNKHFRRSCTSR